MADGTTLDLGSGGDVIATDDITDGGVADSQKAQRIKVGFGINGGYEDASETNPLPVDFRDFRYDTFGRVRTADPLTLFASKQIFDNQPLFWDESLESGADITSAHSTARASTIITSTLNTAGLFTRQTFMRFDYQSGKSQLVYMTGILDASGGGTGVQRRLGYFDDDNGLFFEDDEGTIKVVCRTSATGSAVDNKVTQASWNIDVMDGTGNSGITIDWSKAQIFVFDFEWLGVGFVRMGLVSSTGDIIYVHQFRNANTQDVVYMSTPNLPLRFQTETQGTSAASTLECICAVVITEGGLSHFGVVRRKGTAGAHIDANVENTLYAVLGLRLKSTHLGMSMEILKTSVAEHAGNKNYEWVLLHNPTVAGSPSYTSVATDSGLEAFTGATANTVTGGTEIDGGFASSATKGGAESAPVANELRLGASIGGTVDTVVLCARPVGGSSNIDVEGSITWREI